MFIMSKCIISKREGCYGISRLVPGKPTPLNQCEECKTISLNPQPIPHSYVVVRFEDNKDINNVSNL